MRPVSMTTTLAALLVALAAPVLAQVPAPPAATQTPAVTAPAPATSAPSAPAAAARSAPQATPQAALLDINTATKDELDKLPGIGAARAEAIIKGRPYKAKNELVDKKIIPETAYEGIKERIVARQKS